MRLDSLNAIGPFDSHIIHHPKIIVMTIQLIATGLLAFLLGSVQDSGHQKPAVNYLGIPGPLVFRGKNYQLTWSAHPDATLYKQEYLAAGDALPNYKSMITIDFVVSEATVDDAVRAKLRDLDQLKKTLNVNFEVISDPTTGEKIVDCLLGQTAADETKSIYEHDVYRFKAVTAKSGQKGIVLYALSTRAYGKDITPFLTKLKKERKGIVSDVAKVTLPEIAVT